MANSKILYDYSDKDGYNIQDFFKILDQELDSNKYDLNESDKETVRNLFSLGTENIHSFPKVGVKSDSTNPADYIEKWLNRYIKAHKNRPSSRVANPKSSADDPSLAIMVKAVENYTDDEINRAVKDHSLFMNAENVQGNLLEEYINTHASKEGWIWAEGETIRACDFVRNHPKYHYPEYIQIKNRDNTENSSSSAIRQGTTISKWNRLTTRKKNKKPYPVYNWEKLNELMRLDENNQLSEEDYRLFLQRVATTNKRLLK